MLDTSLSKFPSRGLMLHHFHGEGHNDDRAGSISSSDLENIILSIGLDNFDSALEWSEKIKDGARGYRKWCLTFDDGLRSQFDVAFPVLEKYGLKAFWFVCSSPYCNEFPRLDIYRRFRYHYFDKVEDFYVEFFDQVSISRRSSDPSYLSWKGQMQKAFPFYSDLDIRFRYARDVLLPRADFEAAVDKMIEMRGICIKDLATQLWISREDLVVLHEHGHVLGLHSHDHPSSFARLDTQSQAEQYERNFLFLKEISGRVYSMAHPCGSYSSFTLDFLESLGISIGFRSSTSALGFLPSASPALQLPREDVANFLGR